jgi:hypothetical protein
MAHPLLTFALLAAGVAAVASRAPDDDPKRLSTYERRHRRPPKAVWRRAVVRRAGKIINASGETLEVIEVDGEVMRDEVDIDFVAGGNPGRYTYNPHGTILVEAGMSPKDKAATVLHEAHEDDLMRHQGLSYEDAHTSALRLEKRFRHSADGRAGNRTIERWLKKRL